MASSATLTRRSVDYIKRNCRALAEDPSYFWVKTLARFELARDLAKRAHAAPKLSAPSERTGAHEPADEPPRPSPPRPPRVSVDHGLQGALTLLEREGYYVGLRLTQDALTELMRRVQLATCYGDGHSDWPFQGEQRQQAERRYERSFRRGSYLQQHEHWPEFRALREDPCLLTLAERYLGCAPVYLRSELCWSYPHPSSPRDGALERGPFACEIQDFRRLTFAFYLTDVGSGDGPHSYIKKNPRRRPLSHQLLGARCGELSEQELTRTYGRDQFVTIYGPKGLGFMGDPYYLHRSAAPTQREHLLLQIEFGCKRYRAAYH